MRFISSLGILMGAAFFGVGFATGTKIIANLINVLGIIVANVPGSYIFHIFPLSLLFILYILSYCQFY